MPAPAYPGFSTICKLSTPPIEGYDRIAIVLTRGGHAVEVAAHSGPYPVKGPIQIDLAVLRPLARPEPPTRGEFAEALRKVTAACASLIHDQYDGTSYLDSELARRGIAEAEALLKRVDGGG